MHTFRFYFLYTDSYLAWPLPPTLLPGPLQQSAKTAENEAIASSVLESIEAINIATLHLFESLVGCRDGGSVVEAVVAVISEARLALTRAEIALDGA